jgi:hypothetical protein
MTVIIRLLPHNCTPLSRTPQHLGLLILCSWLSYCLGLHSKVNAEDFAFLRSTHVLKAGFLFRGIKGNYLEIYSITKEMSCYENKSSSIGESSGMKRKYLPPFPHLNPAHGEGLILTIFSS